MTSFLPEHLSSLKRLEWSRRINPTRDWFTLLGIAVIALAVIVISNAWIFDTVANGGTVGRAAPEIIGSTTETSLDSIHTLFTDRAAEESKYAGGTYQYVDPGR